MAIRNDNRLSLSREEAVSLADALSSVLRSWPPTWKRPSPQQEEELRRVLARLERARTMRSPYLSLKRPEREVLWWLSYAGRSELGADVEPWRLVDSLLWIDP